MRNRRQGSALFEVLVAVVMLSGAGTSLMLLLGQTEHSMRAARNAERRERDASAELERFVALDRADFLMLEGQSTRDDLRTVVVERVPGLFDVTLSIADSTPRYSPPILKTTFYRPDSTHDAP